MDLLKQTLEALPNRSEGAVPALMTHIVLGYPNLEESLDIAKALAEAGSAIIELQIPFSDPIADGPTIMEANEVARENGVNATKCLKALKSLSREVQCPLLFMSYLNPVYKYKNGLNQFFVDAKKAGAQGLIVPDVPPENTDLDYWTGAKEHNLAAIPLVSPLTKGERLDRIASLADSKFVYCISNTATTGAKHAMPTDLSDYLKRVARKVKAPLAVGFGISKPEHTMALRGLADIAIVGSATIDVVRKTPKTKRLSEIRTFVKKLLHR
jgi:tryptophan synthase alpha subunit